MKPRQDWLADAAQRQRNIDPIQRILNGARFHGSLIKGGRTLTAFQRVAAMVVGMLSLFSGCYFLAPAVNALKNHAPGSDLWLVLLQAALATPLLWIGFKIMSNAALNEPAAKKPVLGLKKKF